eukprot:7235642-Pyramimonas_sp.AAC.1
MRIWEARIFSKLLYGLESCVLLAADRDRFDGFQARCLQKVHNILPAFISRESNAEAGSLVGARPLSVDLLQKQLDFYGKLARAGLSTLPRRMVFRDSRAHDLLPRQWHTLRRRGKP